MKLWMASNITNGAWYDVNEINPMTHGRAESGEILRYYDNDKKTLIASYAWDDQYSEYKKQNIL